ncbi:MAG: ATP-NAD kinase family protein [Candidatus Bathyarchaeota archaeon]|jgi:predicted polyphosphate/ATP-dependent NAD kinase
MTGLKLGFIVNPIAGMGGRVGLKGTDGVLVEAIGRGASPVAPGRAVEFLRQLKNLRIEVNFEVVTCPGLMGGREAEVACLPVQILPMIVGKITTAEDTKKAVKLMVEKSVNLIVFVGGDGTAKDIYDVLKGSNEVWVLGIPSGVKMYSGIFTVNVSDAVELFLAFAKGEAEIMEHEIMDADEDAIRTDTMSIRLYGYLKGPFQPTRIQGVKQASPQTNDEKENQRAIARFILEEMTPKTTYILGPGTTIKCFASLLGVEKTLLGIDLYKEGKVILDVNEKKILESVEDWKNTRILISPIGRQGILLGRGNQPISPEIIKRVGKERIIVAATKSKLQSIEGSVLRVDTGEPEIDKRLQGYIKVVTDYREWQLVPVR